MKVLQAYLMKVPLNSLWIPLLLCLDMNNSFIEEFDQLIFV
jgi:hypothetical protein